MKLSCGCTIFIMFLLKPSECETTCVALPLKLRQLPKHYNNQYPLDTHTTLQALVPLLVS